MQKKNHILYEQILSKGYLPRELPRHFSSTSLGSVADKKPKDLLDLAKKELSQRANHYNFSLARTSDLRRVLSIPNPIHFSSLAFEISDNWQNLEPALNKSKALSKPYKPDTTEHTRALLRENDFSIWPMVRLAQRATAKYLLKADINKFYPSIYTHSIPWALHGKKDAKKYKNDKTLLGNKIDFLIRQGQDGQTIGIPIGPDTSMLLAEIILARVDEMLIDAGISNFTRYTDDFEFSFNSFGEAKKALVVLQSILKEYELELNSSKTQIIELPDYVDDLGISKLRSFEFRRNSYNQQIFLSALDFMNLAIECFKNNPRSNALKYAILKLGTYSPQSTKEMETIINFFLSCIQFESGCIEQVLKSIERFSFKWKLNKDHLEKAFNLCIQDNTEVQHTSEVCWALQGCIDYKINIDEGVFSKILEMKDSCSSLLALKAKSLDLVNANTELNILSDYLNADELFNKNWLFAYEITQHDFLPKKKFSYLKTSDFFQFLNENAVSFFDFKAKKTPTWAEVITQDYFENTPDDMEDEDDDEVDDEDDFFDY